MRGFSFVESHVNSVYSNAAIPVTRIRSMRISEIHVYQKNLPVVGGPYTISTMTLHEIDTTIIKMVPDTGLIGWGR